MKRITILAAVAVMIASCAKTQFETLEQETATTRETHQEVTSFGVWSERCNTIPESRFFGLEVTYADGTCERVPFDWRAADITDGSEHENEGTGSAQGQWYASGNNVSIVKLTSLKSFDVKGQKCKIEAHAIISHADNNL